MSLQAAWYRKAGWLVLLLPLSWLFRVIGILRRKFLQWRNPGTATAAVPVIIVGNITVGGTGKTPLLISMARLLQAEGWRPAIISRGYGGKAPGYPLRVSAGTDPAHAGDEPVLLARELPETAIWVDPVRCRARDAAIASGTCDLVLSDDGLQHYALARQLELVVIDGERGLGNGMCLPAGPLREPVSRLRQVDFILVNEALGDTAARLPEPAAACHRIHLEPEALVNLLTGERVALTDVARHPELCALLVAGKQDNHAVAGIGNPGRFFESLQGLGYQLESRAFPDHHPYSHEDLEFAGDGLLLMTAKDAVKCDHFARPGWWYVAAGMKTTADFNKAFLERVRAIQS